MSALAERQREFARALLDDAGGADAGGADAGLDVYRASVLSNFSAALTASYPVVRRLVGDAFFSEMARRFALAHPSTSGDLNEYGAGFPAFIAGYPHAAALPYLHDVARLEWACHESEQAPEPAPFDFEALARVDPARYGELRFQLHPSVRLLESAHPIGAIHEANAPGRDGAPSRVEGRDFIVVHRVDGRAVVSSLDVDTWRLLSRIAAGEEAFAAAFAGYVSKGIIAGFTAPPCER
jgi:hypothetical protein